MPSWHEELARSRADQPRLLQAANSLSALTAAGNHVPPPAQRPAMEANHTSPPPTSPAPTTHGDDLCRMDVTDMAIDSVTLIICLCGLLGNGAILWLVGFCIRRNPITSYILNLAVADFTFLLFMATLALLYIVENISCSPVGLLMYLRSFFQFSLSYNMSLYLLTAISIERCVSIFCPLWYRCHHPQHLSVVVCTLLSVFCITLITLVTSLCLLHEHEHCQMALISMYILNFLIFAPSLVISSTILFIKVLCASQQRHPKRLYIVIFLTVLFFLIFGIPLSIWNFLQQVSYTAMSSQTVLLLACINNSIKPFIYFLVGSCQRHCSLVSPHVAFRSVFEEPEDNTACSNDTTMYTLAPAS